jgi:TIR domain-containing protein
MAEIFISYSREDRDWVERLASQLQSEGYSVWWDWDLLVGKRYRETIDNELQTCRAAVVVWSQHSVQSDFVRDEAEEAQQRNILVPILKEMVRPPAGFRQIQTADLSTWTGGGTHAEFRRVVKGISFMVGRPATGDSSGASASDPHSPPRTPSITPADSANLSKPTAGVAAKAALATRSEANKPALLSRLPPATHRIWRYAAIAVVALVGVLLIVSYLPSTSSKPPAPASVVGGPAPAAANAAANSDEGDIGQTGPHNATTPTTPPPPTAPPEGNATGDDGDIGQAH